MCEARPWGHFRNIAPALMSINDLLKYCDIISVCHLDIKSQGLFEASVTGMWTKGISDGGYENLSGNPQFKVTFVDTDEDDDSMATVIISLLVKGSRSCLGTIQNKGFSFYRIEDSTTMPLDAEFLENNEEAGSCHNTGHRKEVKRFTVEPGTFVIIPYLSGGEENTEFYLCGFAESEQKLEFL